jgi:hypothetical protein
MVYAVIRRRVKGRTEIIVFVISGVISEAEWKQWSTNNSTLQ